MLNYASTKGVSCIYETAANWNVDPGSPVPVTIMLLGLMQDIDIMGVV